MRLIKKKLLLITVMVKLLAVLSVTVAAMDYVNAIPNGDFESGQTGWTGTVKSVTVDGQSVYVGENNVTQTARIQLRPNTTYNIRCLFMEKDKVEGMEDALFGIILYDSQGNEITSSSQAAEQPENIYYSTWQSVWYRYLSYFNTASWDSCNFTFKTGDSTAEGLIKLIRLNTSRTYYFDRIEIYEMPFSEYLHNGGFENSYTWNDREFGWVRSLGNSEIISNSDSGFGDKHLRITGGAFYDRGAVRTFDKVLIQPNTEYTFSALLRTDKAPVTNEPALVGIKFYDKNQTQITSGGNMSYSSFLGMHFKYIYKNSVGTTWCPWKTRFITPPNAYLAEVFLYKWCSDQNDDPTYIEADQLSLSPENDLTAYGNYGFEAIDGSTINQWTGGYTISTSACDGRYALQVNNYDWAESNYIPVNGNEYYLFRTMVMEPQDVTAYNSVYFTVQVFDANKTSLDQSVSVSNLGTHFQGVHWFAYIYGTPMDNTFEPTSEWQRYERWFKLPASAKYIKIRLWNNRSGYSTRFDNTEIRELKYRTAAQSGTKSMTLWYGNISWPSPYMTSDKIQAFYPYIAHATSSQLDQFDEWMLESVLFMASLPPQTPSDWNAYLDRLFATTGDWQWLLNLNQAVSNIGTILSDSTHKVNVIISVPLDSDNYSPDNFSSVVTSPATDEKVADWYYNNVMQRWNAIQNSIPRLNLLGFYIEDEYPLGSAKGFIKAMAENIKANGYKLYASPYIIKQAVTIDGVTKYRDLSRVSNFQPEFYDAHFIQPNYFYNDTDRTSSLVDYTILWSGINNCGLNLEWTGNNERFQHYLDCAETYGMLFQDTSYMLFEVAGWLYTCATGTDQTRKALYDNLNDLLHNR